MPRKTFLDSKIFLPVDGSVFSYSLIEESDTPDTPNTPELNYPIFNVSKGLVAKRPYHA